MQDVKYDKATLKNLCRESVRKRTFKNWPLKFLSDEELAKNGFFYEDEKDHVICIFCGVEIGDWEQGDKVEEEHKKHSPDCSVFRQSDARSVPNRSHDECGCVIGHKKRKNYDSLETRFNSFKDWPVSMKQIPKEMAQAGFYYTGKGDKVMCFNCELGLNKWEEADEPWFEHARWSPLCEFVLQEKGENFVREVQKKVEEMKSKEHREIQKNHLASLAPGKLEPLASTNSTTEDPLICCVCKTEIRNIVSLPCRHLATCESCNKKVIACPVCKQEETSKLKVYIP